jgi:hypothetical protein
MWLVDRVVQSLGRKCCFANLNRLTSIPTSGTFCCIVVSDASTPSTCSPVRGKTCNIFHTRNANTVLGPSCPQTGERLFYCDDVEVAGEEFFWLACQRDLVGILAKRRFDPYLPDGSVNCYKIRNHTPESDLAADLRRGLAYVRPEGARRKVLKACGPVRIGEQKVHACATPVVVEKLTRASEAYARGPADDQADADFLNQT